MTSGHRDRRTRRGRAKKEGKAMLERTENFVAVEELRSGGYRITLDSDQFAAEVTKVDPSREILSKVERLSLKFSTEISTSCLQFELGFGSRRRPLPLLSKNPFPGHESKKFERRWKKRRKKG
jgi:hypothetical protein